jgi:glycosyltransferase involved in cell wall biosynthesis
MNILMLSDVYFPRVNGVSTSIRTFADELTRLGHSVTLVAPSYGDSAENDSFEIIRLPSRRIFFDPEDQLFKFSAIRRIAGSLAQRQWDAIHIHTPFLAHKLGVKLGRLTGCKTVETYHTYFEEYIANYLPWLPSWLLRRGSRWYSRRLCQQVDHLIVPTQQMVEVLDRYGITTPSSVIATGIDLDRFRGGDGERFRRDHDIAPNRPTLVTVGRLALEKNISFLLTVVRALIEEFPDLLFVIAGEGPDAERLKRQTTALGLDKNVYFVGNLDRNSTLLDCYKAGDVFVFASPTETQGLVLIEAMALGVPIVSTAVMGTATVLANAHSARISTEDVASFAGHVAEVLRSPSARKTLSLAGPDDAKAWSVPRLMSQVVELYADLGKHKRPQEIAASANT